MAWPKGVKKSEYQEWKAKEKPIMRFSKVHCPNCNLRMAEIDYRNFKPGQAEYQCLSCGHKEIVDFTNK